MKSRVLMALISVLLLGVTAQSASAALGPAEKISTPEEALADSALVGMDPSGLATAFWIGQSGVPLETGIVSRTRSGDGGWQEAKVVSGGLPVFEFDAAVGANGRAVVAWVSSSRAIYAAHRSSAGIWTAPEVIKSAESGSDAPGVQVAIDAAGNAVVVWKFENATPAAVSAYARYRSAATGIWSATDAISGTTVPGGDGVDVIADGLGNFVAAWYRLGGDYRVATATRPAGDASAWSSPENPVTSVSFPTGKPALASDGAGNVIIAWRQYIEELFVMPYFTNSELWAVRRPAGGAWGSKEVVSGPDIEVRFEQAPGLAFDGQGTARALWVNGSGADDQLRTSTRTAGGAWTTPETIAQDDTDITKPALGVDSTGNSTVLWRAQDVDDDFRIELSERPAGGSWTPAEIQAESFSPYTASNFPSVAAAGDGGAVAVWNAQATSGSPPTDAFARYVKPSPAAPGSTPLPVTTPSIGTIRILPKKIYRKARVRGSKKKRKTAAKIQFSLSESADVTLTLALRIKGRVVGGKCVRATKRNKRRRSCELVVPWGKPIVAGRQTGAVSLPFTSKRLRKGNYYLTVNAVSPTGQTAVPKRAKLTVG